MTTFLSPIIRILNLCLSGNSTGSRITLDSTRIVRFWRESMSVAKRAHDREANPEHIYQSLKYNVAVDVPRGGIQNVESLTVKTRHLV